ncbi:MAG: hypothetical protein V3T87_03635, partial [Candidatus Thorarchaeota archaeon]
MNLSSLPLWLADLVIKLKRRRLLFDEMPPITPTMPAILITALLSYSLHISQSEQSADMSWMNVELGT